MIEPQIPMSWKVPKAETELETQVLVEYRGSENGRAVHNTSSQILFVDKTKNRIGIKDIYGGHVYVPLSDVLDLLKRGVL